MAKIIEWTDEQRSEWDNWVQSRPEPVKSVAQKLPPDRLYKLKSTGQRATLYSYSEDGTLTVNVTGQYNKVLFGRRVFGILPEDLEECDLPSEGEDLGDVAAEAGYTVDDVRHILIPKLAELEKDSDADRLGRGE